MAGFEVIITTAVDAATPDQTEQLLKTLVVCNVDDLLMEVGVGEQSGRSVSGGGVGEFGVGAACLLDDGDERCNVPGAGPEQEERIELSSGDQQSAVGKFRCPWKGSRIRLG